MATSDTSTADSPASTFPISLSRAESHSWEYGHRCVDREGTHRETWTDESDRQSLTVFDVTDHTVVLRYRTPVGRQSFYGMAARDYSAARETLVADEDWTVQTSPDGQ
ncbi:hypothetical protein [Haloarcula nitratireducens]|uniref:Uncharacterized protein n=1 Tax=Haloarcula nitratireducens TaxID=2487749 RepID=A0AAW4PDM1_9EURY|nr:hypothetical protein [Halomicroarcula nitratireducens]MBX0296361.1 hypothetical protein [Halomicroarcula nitratireducens]